MMIKRLLLAFLFAFVLGTPSYATTYPAASCSSSNVQTAINHAAAGDTVTIPAGNCMWSTVVTVNKNITVQGAGEGSTNITDNYTAGAALVFNISGSAFARLAGFTWVMGGNLVPCKTGCKGASMAINGSASSNATQFRMDHITFSGWSGTNIGYLIQIDNTFGVIDHINAVMGYGVFIDIFHSSYLGVGRFGDNSWAQPDSYGTANELYIEDSYFKGTAAHGMGVTDCDGNGCRMVIRHNIIIEGTIETHGTESPGRRRGARHVEIYDNQFLNDASMSQTLGHIVVLCSGTMLFFNNTIGWLSAAPAWQGYSTGIAVDIYRAADGLGGWAFCDGRGPYDQNDGTIYASGTATSGGVNNVLTDISRSWRANQWLLIGAPYSLINVTQGWGSEIISSTATTITTRSGAGYGGVNDIHPWSAGDQYQIKRATVCIDQTTYGQSNLLSGTDGPNGLPSQLGFPNNVLDPVYVFNNTVSGTNVITAGALASGNNRNIRNRNIFEQCFTGSGHGPCTSFDGTQGTGAGLLSLRPATCSLGVGGTTPGVGYWATDTNTLYKCTATNTWTATYTPYTYPHPLTLGSKSGSNIAAPTSLTATVQ